MMMTSLLLLIVLVVIIIKVIASQIDMALAYRWRLSTRLQLGSNSVGVQDRFGCR